MPISNASANSWRATAPMTPAPRISSDSTGMIDERLVINDRMSTWFIEMFTTSSYGMRTAANLPSFSSTRSNTTMVS